jgi:hypothetical protein
MMNPTRSALCVIALLLAWPAAAQVTKIAEPSNSSLSDVSTYVIEDGAVTCIVVHAPKSAESTAKARSRI